MFAFELEKVEKLLKYSNQHIDEVSNLVNAIDIFMIAYVNAAEKYDENNVIEKNAIILNTLMMFCGLIVFNRDLVEDVIRILKYDETHYEQLLQLINNEF